ARRAMNLAAEHYELLLLIVAVVATVASRLRLPYTVGLVLAGIGLAVAHFNPGLELTRALLFTALLPPLVFEAAFYIPWRRRRRGHRRPARGHHGRQRRGRPRGGVGRAAARGRDRRSPGRDHPDHGGGLRLLHHRRAPPPFGRARDTLRRPPDREPGLPRGDHGPGPGSGGLLLGVRRVPRQLADLYPDRDACYPACVRP